MQVTPKSDYWLIKLTLLLASTLTIMSGAIIAPALPAMQSYFANMENSDLLVRLVLTMPALFIAVGSPIIGQLVDTVGRKSLLIGSAILYGFAGSSAFFLDSLLSILVGRGLLGLAVAGIMVSATTLIADYYEGDHRSQFMGLQAAFMSLGGVIFLPLGGVLADASWRFPFTIYLFSWMLLPFMMWVLYEPNRPEEIIDRGTVGSALEDAAITQIPAKLMAFVGASALLSQVVFYLIPVQLPFYLKALTDASATQSGIAIASVTLAGAIASLNYGKFKQKFSYLAILAIALILMGIGYIGIGLIGNYILILLALIPTGFGLGLIMPNLNLWVTSEVPGILRGRSLGLLTTALFLGQFLSPIISQPLNRSLGLSAIYGLAGVVVATLGTVIWIFHQQISYWVKPYAER